MVVLYRPLKGHFQRRGIWRGVRLFPLQPRRQAGLPDGQLRPDGPPSPAVSLRLRPGQAARAPHRHAAHPPDGNQAECGPRPGQPDLDADRAGRQIRAAGHHGRPPRLRHQPAHHAGYYSYPRLSTTGTLVVGGKTHQVSGELWYDRQWNSGAVNKKHVAWDWLSIQLKETKDDLMLYAVHNKKTQEHIGGGSHYGTQGENTHLTEADFKLEPLTYWTSPTSKRKYPAKWRVAVPSKGYDLVVEPLVPQQELSLKLFKVLNLHYWEGMCRVTGTHNGQPVTR